MEAPGTKAQQEEKPDLKDLPQTSDDDESDVIASIQAGNDLEGSESDDDRPDPYEGMTEEEAWAKFNSTAYDRSSMKPMKEPLTAPLVAPISDDDVKKLKVGFKSKSMDDKWDLLIEDPDEHGGFSVQIIRNWLQEQCYVLHVAVSKPQSPSSKGETKDVVGDRSEYGAEVRGITWEGNKAGLRASAEQAQKETVMLARNWLDCKLEAFPEYSWDKFWDPEGYTKLETEANTQ